MNTHHQTAIRRKPGTVPWAILSVAFLVLLVATAPVQAQADSPSLKLDFPLESPGIPAYARLELLIEGFNVPNNEEWAAIVFYRDPDCVPTDFDLGQFFHVPGPEGPGAFGCRLLIEGFEHWLNGPGEDLSPVYVRSRNAVPDLPVWFVSWPELEALFDSGMVFIDEIEALPSLIRGAAWWFEEALYPNETAPDPALTFNAHGRLETGGRFVLGWHFHASAGEDEVLIHFEMDSPPNGGQGPGRPPHVKCIIHPHLPGCNN